MKEFLRRQAISSRQEFIDQTLLRVRMNIEIVSLASVCIDNASNLSNAMSLNDHLKKVSTFCICHLVNIAVKRTIMNPAESVVRQDDEEDNGDDIMQPNSKRQLTSRYWFYAEKEEEVVTDYRLSVVAYHLLVWRNTCSIYMIVVQRMPMTKTM